MGCCNSCANGGRFNIPGLCSPNPSQPFIPPDPVPYIIKVNTAITYTGSTADNQIQIPFNIGIGGMTIDWGDTTSNFYTGAITSATHTYANPGIYIIKIYNIRINTWFNTPDRLKIIEVVQWGQSVWGTIGNGYRGCSNLQLTAIDAPIFTALPTNLNYAFADTPMNSNINHWNVSMVTDIEFMFQNAPNFNSPLNLWNTSNLIRANAVFNNASSFNQSIGAWQIPNLIRANSILTGSAISPDNLADIYAQFSLQTVQPNVPFFASGRPYTASIGAAGRAILTGAPNFWNIDDGGPV
jgi:hypothetical protein